MFPAPETVYSCWILAPRSLSTSESSSLFLSGRNGTGPGSAHCFLTRGSSLDVLDPELRTLAS